jgi:hypothetical protein
VVQGRIDAGTEGLLARTVRPLLAVLLVTLGVTCTAASAGTRYIDGISDQSVPVWDGSFAGSPFASYFRSRWIAAASGQITLARYVVQWDAMTHDRGSAHHGDGYGERFEAWLQDARSMGLIPVVALTSYDHLYPGSPADYRSSLEAILTRATAMGYPISYVEPWNEPNGQGHEDALTAAAFANSATGVCEQMRTCRVIAGDFEDRSTVTRYERAYEAALTSAPSIWGVHPYVSVASHNDANLVRLISALPAHLAARQIWFTEIGALYCGRGQVRGEARQASDAAYLVNSLLGDPAVAPTHAFYYGFLFGGHVNAPCAAGGGDDSELYSSSDEPRAAARILLRPPFDAAPSGPARGLSAALEPRAPAWPPWVSAANLMIEPFGDPTGPR